MVQPGMHGAAAWGARGCSRDARGCSVGCTELQPGVHIVAGVREQEDCAARGDLHSQCHRALLWYRPHSLRHALPHVAQAAGQPGSRAASEGHAPPLTLYHCPDRRRRRRCPCRSPPPRAARDGVMTGLRSGPTRPCKAARAEQPPHANPFSSPCEQPPMLIHSDPRLILA